MNNKGAVISVLIIVLLSMFSGTGYREIDRQYIVSAMGFDMEDGVRLTVEVIAADNIGGEVTSEPLVFTALADDAKGALSSLSDSLSKPLSFDHCAVVIIGNTLSFDTLSSVIDFCGDLQGLGSSAYFLAATNASELLNTELPYTYTSKGYEIMGVAKQSSKIENQKNRLYKLEAAKDKNAVTLPVLNVGDNGFLIEGKFKFDRVGEKV